MSDAEAVAAAAELAIRQRLKDDLAHYAATCLKIRSKRGKIEALVLNGVQCDIHERLEAQRAATGRVRALILKARQPGVSTYVGARFYWKVTHGRGLRAFILTHRDQATANLFAMAKRFHRLRQGGGCCHRHGRHNRHRRAHHTRARGGRRNRHSCHHRPGLAGTQQGEGAAMRALAPRTALAAIACGVLLAGCSTFGPTGQQALDPVKRAAGTEASYSPFNWSPPNYAGMTAGRLIYPGRDGGGPVVAEWISGKEAESATVTFATPDGNVITYSAGGLRAFEG